MAKGLFKLRGLKDRAVDALGHVMLDSKGFFRLGMICFFIITICSIALFVQNFGFMPFFVKVKDGAYILFNIGMIAFFNYLYKGASTGLEGIQLEEEDCSEEELKEVFEN